MDYYWDRNNVCQWVTNGVIVLDQKSGRNGDFEKGQWTEVASGQSDEGKKTSAGTLKVNKDAKREVVSKIFRGFHSHRNNHLVSC